MFKELVESAKLVKQYNKGILAILLLRSILASVSPLFNTIMIGLLIDYLFQQKDIPLIIIIVATMIISNFVLALINNVLNSLLSVKQFYINQHYQAAKTKAYFSIDYAKIENAEIGRAHV